jgi:hypothetical protein
VKDWDQKDDRFCEYDPQGFVEGSAIPAKERATMLQAILGAAPVHGHWR